MALIYWKKSILPCLLSSLLFLFILHAQLVHGSPTGNNLKFRFAIAAQVTADGKAKIIPVENGTVLNSGDFIKFYLESITVCYFYIFYVNSQNELSLLFPQHPYFEPFSPSTSIFVPEPNRWFELDSKTGKESFYLLASETRLKHLENLYQNHLKITDKSARGLSQQSILKEIRATSRDSLAKPAERPIRIGGQLRGAGAENNSPDQIIAALAWEITSESAYYRKITVEHK
jgi:Domain of unknown function (DUF4384)